MRPARYQVGSFANLRWAEWNGRYRDDVRRFWRGDRQHGRPLATRLAGSSDLYQASGRQPYHSINFITSHDGFTLNDLVTYNEKHNEANGEDNRDGDNNNYSYNYGVEGPTTPRHRAHPPRQMRNFLATLFLSQGVPMLLAGDECRRTQRGNNNAYCQDNEISWFDWDLVAQHVDLVRFTQALIAFRKRQPTLRRSSFLRGEPLARNAADISWFNAAGGPVDWTSDELSLTCLLAAPPTSNVDERPRHILLLNHAGTLPCEFSHSRRAHGRSAGTCSSTRPPTVRRTSIPIWTVRNCGLIER